MPKFIGYFSLLFLSFALVNSCQMRSQTFSKDSSGLNQDNINLDKQDTISNMNNDDSETDFLNLPVKSKIQGKYLKAVLISYKSFADNSSIPNEKRNIINYDVEIREDSKNFYVIFNAHRTKEEVGLDGGSSSLGQDVIYIIDKNTYDLKRWFFVK